MKYQSIKLYFFISLFFIVTSCKTDCNHSKNANESCYPNSEKPSQVITYQEMAAMMDSYDNGAKKELNKYLKKVSHNKDSVSTNYNWYKLENLKQYIAYIERISKEKNIPVTGFRIYPAQYPKKYSDKKLQNRNTIIFTPTTTINNRDDVAFEPLYSEMGKPVEISKFLEQVREKSVQKSTFLPLSATTQSLESSSANRLKPTPPY